MATQNHCLSRWSSPNVGWFWSPPLAHWSCRGALKIMSPNMCWLVVTGTMEFWMTFHKKKSEFHKIPTDFHSIIFQRGRAQPPSSMALRQLDDSQNWTRSYNFNGMGLGFRSRRSVRWFDVQLTGDFFSEIHRKSALLYIISRRTDVHCFSVSVLGKAKRSKQMAIMILLPSGKLTCWPWKSPIFRGN